MTALAAAPISPTPLAAPQSDGAVAAAAPIDLKARRRFWLLLSLGGPIGFIGALPYLLPLLRKVLEAAPGGASASRLALTVLGQGVQISLITAFAAWAGTRLRARSGFDAPWIRAVAERRSAPRSFLAEVPRALIVGAAFSAAILALTHFARPILPEAMREQIPAGSEKLSAFLGGASSAFYGGIIEELLLRWGLLSALAALFTIGKRGLTKDGARRELSSMQFWSANLLCALVFGAGHLPVLFQLHLSITAPIVAYVVVANALAGLCCGWMLRRRGLEPAMVAHGFGDICLHALPLLAA